MKVAVNVEMMARAALAVKEGHTKEERRTAERAMALHLVGMGQTVPEAMVGQKVEVLVVMGQKVEVVATVGTK